MLKQHDGHAGAITGVQYNADESLILSAGHDGLLVVNQFDRLTAREEARFDALAKVEGANFLPAEEK